MQLLRNAHWFSGKCILELEKCSFLKVNPKLPRNCSIRLRRVFEKVSLGTIWFGSDPDQSYNNLSPSINPFKNLQISIQVLVNNVQILI
jgi:hypothetical protein